MTKLLPETLTIWDKFCGIVEDHGPPRLALAAALRAAADQVVPADALYARSCCEFVGEQCRARLLFIAVELENSND